MAIGFARLEFVKRSSGQNACYKSAYISRSTVHFDGHDFQSANTYDWSFKEKPVYHEIFLPKHVNEIFRDPERLWNAVELKEAKKNSQLALDVVLALPDDKEISLEDKINLLKSFVQEHFIDKGLGAEVAIHKPDNKAIHSPELGEIENLDHNWHAHVLLTTRRFTEDGKEIGEKARDLMPMVRGGVVISGPNWGKFWAQHQNKYFEERGFSLRVDPNGSVRQLHLGPVRLRGERSFLLTEQNNSRIELNQIDSQDPEKILKTIIETQSIFSFEDIERFLSKHVEVESIKEVRESFWKQGNVVQLIDLKTGEALNKYTTHEVIDEEEKILRLSDRINLKSCFKLNMEKASQHSDLLNDEQKVAYQNIISGKRLSFIEGHAGTGKSHLLAALKSAYENEGYIVRAFGPDNATANVLKEKGFSYTENIYKFLFSLQHKSKKLDITNNKEVWIVDESGKLGNLPLMEFFKKAEIHGAQVVLSGCSSQLPSVERGGMFKVLCERHGHESLVHIYRQKEAAQKEISTHLAYGRISQAINTIVSTGGIKWYETKNDSTQELVKKWAIDQIAFPESSSLIIAHSNEDVKILNDMVHFYRKERGELGDKEFECETKRGKIFVSLNDQIEFRAKNSELGVSNGLHGTLIEASPEKFVVVINEEGKSRKIVFDPRKYIDFQLNYASTYHRSQGRTIDRAYVLHSRQLNKELFYVGMTRHVHKAYFFVSNEETRNLSDLKRQASRSCLKPTTTEYLTNFRIEKEKELAKRTSQINELKNSDSTVSKLKGYSMAGWGGLRSTVSKFVEKRRDLKADAQFFNPQIKNETRTGAVKEVSPANVMDQSISRNELQSKDLSKVAQLMPPLLNSKKHDSEQVWQKLSIQERKRIDSYYASVNHAAILQSIVKEESKGVEEKQKHTPHFKEWMIACGLRNENAHKLERSFKKNELESVLGKDAVEILQDRSSRYELAMQRKESGKIDLQDELKANFEALVYKLFPEGPTKKERNGLRFGTKGSLSVVCQGKEAGSFYDFGNEKGGGPLTLIQNRLGLNPKEAREWASDFLGLVKEISIPSHYTFKNKSSEKSVEWQSMRAGQNNPAPDLKTISSTLNNKYNESARHIYRDVDGNILFYILRLVDKTDPSEKMIRPLSYGFWKGGENTPCWSLKGYQGDTKPLYNAHQLSEKPEAAILLVEGEKTADAAANLSKNTLCMTWCGGAAVVSKADWSVLFGRDVVIWPDNDKAGYKASDDVCSELRRVGVKSLRVVDKDVLAKEFPQKWDLADPLPNGQDEKIIKDLILGAQEKGVGLINHASLGLKDTSFGNKLRLNELVWRLEERLRPSLEEKHGSKSWEIKNEIFAESAKMFKQLEHFEQKLKADYGMDGLLAQRLSYQMALHAAMSGSPPSDSKISEMKETISSLSRVIKSPGEGTRNELHEYAFDKTISKFMEYGASTNDIQKRIPFINQEIIKFTDQTIKLAEIEKNFVSQIKAETSRNQKIEREI